MPKAIVVPEAGKRAETACPVCKDELVPFVTHGRTEHRCPSHHGKLLKLSALHSWIREEEQRDFELAVKNRVPSINRCPRCRKRMGASTFYGVPFESCASCFCTWIMEFHMKRLPLKSEEEREKSSNAPVQVEANFDLSPGTPFSGIRHIRSHLLLSTTLLIIAFAVLTHQYWLHQHLKSLAATLDDPARALDLSFPLSLFVHEDAVHLVGNAFFLYFCGKALEPVLGWHRFLMLFMLCGLGGECVAAICRDDSMVGSGGAISGLILALAWAQPHGKFWVRPLDYLPARVLPFTISIPIPLWMWGCLWLSVNLRGMIAPVPGLTETFGYAAHFGGALIGLLLAQLPFFRAAHGWAAAQESAAPKKKRRRSAPKGKVRA